MSTPLPARPTDHEQATKLNSIRLDLAKLVKLLDVLDAKEQTAARANRQFVRWPFRHVCVPLTITHAAGSKASVGVACRNISCGGISVLHNAYVYPKSACEISLPHNGGYSVNIPGKIMRCGHLTGIVHEVGIQFDAPIRMSDFVTKGSQADAMSIEKVDSTSLRGTILFIGATEMDQQIARHFLRETTVRLQYAGTPEDAMAKATAAPDMIIVDADFDAATDPSFIARLRAEGIMTPVLAILSTPSEDSLSPGSRLKIDAVISRPITERGLLQVIAGLLKPGGLKGLTVSSLPPDHPSSFLVRSFIEESHRQAETLEAAVGTKDAAKCITLCRQIEGIAPVVGFEALAQLAKRAETTISASMSVEESIADLRRLITSCRKTRNA